MKKFILSIGLTLLVSISAFSKELPAAAKSEIAQLLTKLEQSNCQFNRNGSWYTAKDAKAHLNKKFEYLADKGEIASTEQFIELGASQSSMSGKPYWVQCAGASPIESASWLSGQLKQIRTQATR
jgi:Family of unknown function (DUF5329)